MKGNGLPEGRKALFKMLFNEGERECPGDLNLQNRLFPCEPFLLFRSRLAENIFLGNPDLVKLALDDLIDEKYFLRKNFLTRGFFPGQIGISSKAKKNPRKKERRYPIPPLDLPRLCGCLAILTYSLSPL